MSEKLRREAQRRAVVAWFTEELTAYCMAAFLYKITATVSGRYFSTTATNDAGRVVYCEWVELDAGGAVVAHATIVLK